MYVTVGWIILGILTFMGVVVTAFSAVVVVIVVACLVSQTAQRAIEKAAPDQVSSVVAALGSLIGPFRDLLPWSDRRLPPPDSGPPSCDDGMRQVDTQDDELPDGGHRS